jgi:hypothetical protein
MLTLAVGVFGVMHAYAANDTANTSTNVNNVSPVITQTPSDGGSNNGAGLADSKGNPTNVGSLVTFSANAHDTNSDSYYLAVCKTNVITAGNDAAPTCESVPNTWAISAVTANDAAASVTYTTLQADVESNAWYAFTCDKVSGSAACYPVTGGGDQGYAEGTATFSVRPSNGDTITINSDVYEFNTSTCGGGHICVTVTPTGDGSEAASNLAAADATTGVHMVSRGNVTYIYADAKGVAGNSIALTKSSSAITVSGAVLAGGDDDNASPFYVNHKPVINSYAYGHTAATGLTAATGDVIPGDTLHISTNVTDTDTNPTQDTVSMYVCTSAGFTAGATPACTGTEYCHVTGVNPATTDPDCSGTNLTSVPTAHGTYHVFVYVVDNHGFQATEGDDHTFDVQEVAPVLTAYTATDAPAPSAGGSDTVDFSLTLYDNNGDNDVTAINGVFFDKGVVTNTCTASENNCYPTVCTITPASVSTPTAAGTKTAMGLDKDLAATCQVTVYSNADASNWTVEAKATDSTVVTAFADAGVNLTNPPLQGIDIVTSSIAYGTVAIGGTSAGQETSMGNVGNQILDVIVSGTDMTDGHSHTIPAAQQKWDNSVGTFDWDSTGAAGPWALLNAASGTNETGGCINRDIAVRTDHASTTNTNESIFWKIRIPASQQSGSYTGSNTFTSTASDTCTTAAAY